MILLKVVFKSSAFYLIFKSTYEPIGDVNIRQIICHKYYKL